MMAEVFRQKNTLVLAKYLHQEYPSRKFYSKPFSQLLVTTDMHLMDYLGCRYRFVFIQAPNGVDDLFLDKLWIGSSEYDNEPITFTL